MRQAYFSGSGLVGNLPAYLKILPPLCQVAALGVKHLWFCQHDHSRQLSRVALPRAQELTSSTASTE